MCKITYFDNFEIKFSANILEHPFDVMITDYIGLWGIRDADLFGFYKCRIRVLDSFGTDPSCKKYSYTMCALLLQFKGPLLMLLYVHSHPINMSNFSQL